MAILSPLTEPAATLWSSVTSQTWDSLVALCRNGTIAQLQQIQLGRLFLYDGGSGKSSVVFGNESPKNPDAALHVHSEKFWVRLALFADMVRSASSRQKPCLYSSVDSGMEKLTARRDLQKVTCSVRFLRQI